MLYAVIYEAQEKPAALKYISLSFPSSPALLKPTFICKCHRRYQGHELDECSGRKTTFRKEKGRAGRAVQDGGEQPGKPSTGNSSEDDDDGGQ